MEATDPLGGKERVEYRAQWDRADAYVAPAPAVPGVTFSNPDFLRYRNTLYWDKRAMAVAPGDPAAAHLYHWLHLKGNVNIATSLVESEKPALGRRIWSLPEPGECRVRGRWPQSKRDRAGVAGRAGRPVAGDAGLVRGLQRSRLSHEADRSEGA